MSVQYTKQLESLGHYDIAVVGGGPSGCCAAIEAARNGCRVVLIEATGMLGGMATSGLVAPFMTSYDREGNRPLVGGLFREIIERLAKDNAAILPEEIDSPSIHTSFIKPYHRHVTPFDAFRLQMLLDDMTEEAQVDVLLYTRFADCLCEDGRIRGIVVAALEGLRVIEADIVVDCSGNADVAAAAGVETWKGSEVDGVPQPGTLMFEVNGVRDDEYTARPQNPVKAYRTPEKGRYHVNHEHVYNVDAADSRSMSRAHREARKQVLTSLDTLNNKTPGFENACLINVASVLGIRESRHIRGRYMITVDDVSNGVKYDDRIAAYGFGMDVHTRSSETANGRNFVVEIAEAYYIPYRAMLPVGCDNLIVAGKTICSESQAAGGLRCMPCAMAMGQAAGAACSLAVKGGSMPQDVDTAELQKLLRSHGAILD